MVSFRVYTGTFDQWLLASRSGRLAGPGFSDNLVNLIEWDGVTLDSRVIRFPFDGIDRQSFRRV